MYAYAFPPWLPLFFSTVKLDKQCGPPPSVPFADIVGTSRQEYNDGDWVKFKCQSYYKLQDLRESTKCINGQWSNTIKCLGKYTDPAFACALLQSVTKELVNGKCSFLKLWLWLSCYTRAIQNDKSALNRNVNTWKVQKKYCVFLKK